MCEKLRYWHGVMAPRAQSARHGDQCKKQKKVNIKKQILKIKGKTEKTSNNLNVLAEL